MQIRETGWRTSKYFVSMPKIGEANEGWRSILQCSECGQYWLVDEFDKAQSLFAIKIDNPNKPEESRLLEIHEQALLEKHGGESEQNCMFAGCGNKAVKDFAFCAKCLIARQAVYE
jgi:hypothetical protein